MSNKQPPVLRFRCDDTGSRLILLADGRLMRADGATGRYVLQQGYCTPDQAIELAAELGMRRMPFGSKKVETQPAPPKKPHSGGRGPAVGTKYRSSFPPSFQAQHEDRIKAERQRVEKEMAALGLEYRGLDEVRRSRDYARDGVCAHCKRTRQMAARGLCSCCHRNLGIRCLYPTQRETA